MASNWARYAVGGIPSNVSWYRSSLYSRIHCALTLPHLLEGVEDIGIEHFMPEGPIEAFHKGILIRLARLNVSQGDASLRTPACKTLRQKLWTVV